MKIKSYFQERLEYHIEARKAEKNVEPIPFAGHVCEKCGKTLEIDQVHTCTASEIPGRVGQRVRGSLQRKDGTVRRSMGG